MLAEALAALVVAVAALWLVLQPLVRMPASEPARDPEPIDPEETPKGVALAALKEIEFDRETGKLSDADYESLKTKYTAVALDALRAEQAEAPRDIEAVIADKVRSLRSAATTTSPDALPGVCPVCGPRPESDAVFCSTCGLRLPTSHACARCGAALVPGGLFCEGCGGTVAA